MKTYRALIIIEMETPVEVVAHSKVDAEKLIKLDLGTQAGDVTYRASRVECLTEVDSNYSKTFGGKSGF